MQPLAIPLLCALMPRAAVRPAPTTRCVSFPSAGLDHPNATTPLWRASSSGLRTSRAELVLQASLSAPEPEATQREARGGGDGMVIRQLWRYPVKSGAGEQLQSAALTPEGLAGDRRFMVATFGSSFGPSATGRHLTQREHPRLATLRATLRERGGGSGAAAANAAPSLLLEWEVWNRAPASGP